MLACGALKGLTLARPLAVAAAGIAAAVALTAGSGTGKAAGSCTPDPTWPANRSDLAAAVISLVNQHRQSIGLAPLAVDPALTASAVWKAQHMAAYDYMAHDDPAPPIARPWYQRISDCGFSGAAGENIARWYGTAADVVNAWLSDAPHKANIEGNWTVTGVGAAADASGVIYWAQDFGAGSGSPPPPPPTTTSTPPPPPTTTTSSPPPPTTTTKSPPPPPTTTSSSPPPPAPAPTTTASTSPPAPATTTSQPAPSAQAPKSRGVCVVPNVHRLGRLAARSRLRAAGCSARFIVVKRAHVPAGTVAWQSPRPRVHLPRPAVVTLAMHRR